MVVNGTFQAYGFSQHILHHTLETRYQRIFCANYAAFLIKASGFTPLTFVFQNFS